VADELAKLVQLREAGALTDEEFAAQKAKLLGSWQRHVSAYGGPDDVAEGASGALGRGPGADRAGQGHVRGPQVL